jgi:hypothetical protein
MHKLAWAYTHSWRSIPRHEWGSAISVLASVETLADAKRALAEGYAPMLVLDGHHGEGKAWTDEATGIKIIPCVENTRGIPCSDCKLCLNDEFLRESGAAIAVAAHGGRKAKVQEKLIQLGG